VVLNTTILTWAHLLSHQHQHQHQHQHPAAITTSSLNNNINLSTSTVAPAPAPAYSCHHHFQSKKPPFKIRQPAWPPPPTPYLTILPTPLQSQLYIKHNDGLSLTILINPHSISLFLCPFTFFHLYSLFFPSS